MKTVFAPIVLTAGLIFLLLTGCQPIQPITAEAIAAANEAAEAEFLDAVMAAEESFQSEDAARAAQHYALDAVSMPPGFPASVGRESIEADLQSYFDAFDIEREFNLIDYEVSGDTGTRTAEWTQTLTPTDGGEPFVETGRCVLGYEKVDGEWKVAWEIWNTYE